MIVVFWLEQFETDSLAPCLVVESHYREFTSQQLSDALAFAESKRTARRNGDKISHVTISTELEDSVGEAGVSEPSPGYDWKKRRQ